MNKKISYFISVLSFVIMFTACVFACDKPYSLYHENGLYIVKININAVAVKPYVSDNLETVYDIAKKTNANVAINTGFFDAKNKKTVSFITESGNVIVNPQDNENLTSNPNLKPYLKKIFNRGEIRLYNCNGVVSADITRHNDNLKSKCVLLNSTQAGPIILPDMDLEEEFFVLKQDGKVIRDGAGLTRHTDRSMVAIKNNFIYFIITDEDTKLTIFELKDRISKYKFDKAMGFDGGGSVSLFVKQKDGEFYQDREEKGASRIIKSALLVY